MKYFRHKPTGLVVEVADVRVYPQGGGFERTFTGLEFAELFEPHVVSTEYTPGYVTFDDDMAPVWEAMISFRRWNGWAMPAFTKDVADRIVAWFKPESEDSLRFSYDAERDAYIITNPSYPEEAEVFSACMINGVKFYPLGAGSLCWQEARDEE